MLDEAFIRPPLDNPLFTVVLPEEKIENEPHAGRQEQDDDPRNRLERIPVLGNDHEYQPNDRHHVKQDKNRAEQNPYDRSQQHTSFYFAG